MRIAVAVDKRKAKHAHVEAFDAEEEALSREFAHWIRCCR
jgi:hypothetical protein